MTEPLASTGGPPTHPIGRVHQPLREAVQEAIRLAIVSGRYQQGERLLEDQLAQELDVSRNPVREALQALTTEGFVVIEPRRGARVATVSVERATELFEVREVLEGLVARLAAERRTPEQLDGLRALLQEGVELVAAGGLAELPDLNTRFHTSLVTAAGNQMLAEILGRLSPVISWVYAHRIAKRGEHSWREHAAIVDAIAAGDGRLAQTRASEHIAAARAAYLGE
ncbi:MAG TPA: GntR family transcriptional regulator [Acidimicrobiales bacterium]